jgi:hypothetical protein
MNRNNHINQLLAFCCNMIYYLFELIIEVRFTLNGCDERTERGPAVSGLQTYNVRYFAHPGDLLNKILN